MRATSPNKPQMQMRCPCSPTGTPGLGCSLNCVVRNHYNDILDENEELKHMLRHKDVVLDEKNAKIEALRTSIRQRDNEAIHKDQLIHELNVEMELLLEEKNQMRAARIREKEMSEREMAAKNHVEQERQEKIREREMAEMRRVQKDNEDMVRAWEMAERKRAERERVRERQMAEMRRIDNENEERKRAEKEQEEIRKANARMTPENIARVAPHLYERQRQWDAARERERQQQLDADRERERKRQEMLDTDRMMARLQLTERERMREMEREADRLMLEKQRDEGRRRTKSVAPPLELLQQLAGEYEIPPPDSSFWKVS